MANFQKEMFYNRVINLCGAEKQIKIEEACGIARSSISKWKTSSPKLDTAVKIATYFNVSLDYLAFGEEKKSATEYTDAIPPEAAQDDIEAALLKTFRRLDERGKRTVENAAQAALLEVTAPARDISDDRATPPELTRSA